MSKYFGEYVNGEDYVGEDYVDLIEGEYDEDDYEEDSFVYDELNPIPSQFELEFERNLNDNKYPSKPVQLAAEIDEVETPSAKGWTWAKFETLALPTTMIVVGKLLRRKIAPKKRLCSSIILGDPKRCNKGYCQFAHSFDELERCKFGKQCYHVKWLEGGYYINLKRCTKVHEDECIESYMFRNKICITGCTTLCLRISKQGFDEHVKYFLESARVCNVRELSVVKV